MWWDSCSSSPAQASLMTPYIFQLGNIVTYIQTVSDLFKQCPPSVQKVETVFRQCRHCLDPVLAGSRYSKMGQTVWNDYRKAPNIVKTGSRLKGYIG